MSYGSEVSAQGLFTALTADETVIIHPIDLSNFQLPGSAWLQPIARLTNDDVTTNSLNGTGAFDVMMASLSTQLKSEYLANRITGAEYTKAYIAMVQTAMQSSIQFILGKDQAFWQGVQAQAAAITAQVELETTKLRYAALQLDMINSKANYALTKIRLATEDANYGAAKYNLDTILPLQSATGQYQLDTMLPLQRETGQYQLDYVLPGQVAAVNQQVAAGEQQILQSQQEVIQSQAQVNQINAQKLQTDQQTILIQKQQSATVEQTEATRAQTQDYRLDGTTPVMGVLGKQKDLYTQQITSYKRDAEVKAAKIYSDAWITMLTINESTPVPDSFTNTNLDEILNTLKTNNQL